VPPVLAPRLRDHLGVTDVWLLPHSTNPSGTFKDLEAAFVISKCTECGMDNLAWHSTGNTARSYSLYASLANLATVSFVPSECLFKMKGVVKHPRSQILAYDGPFQELSHVAKSYASSHGLTHIAPLCWKLEGKTVMAYQIAETIPNVSTIVQTIAGGYGFLGMCLGFERLSDAGLWQRPMPRFFLFQIDDADTIATLFRDGFDSDVTPAHIKQAKSVFEPTLQSTNPMATYSAVRKAVLKTQSMIDSVTARDVVEFRGEFEEACKEIGVPVCYEMEKSPFISWAGLRRAAIQKRLCKADRICLIVTGAPKHMGGEASVAHIKSL